jgi:hypothetical protein
MKLRHLRSFTVAEPRLKESPRMEKWLLAWNQRQNMKSSIRFEKVSLEEVKKSIPEASPYYTKTNGKQSKSPAPSAKRKGLQ